MRHHRFRASIAAFACLVLLPGKPQARLIEPNVPADLEVEAGHELYFIGHAVGTQNYMCTATAAGTMTWKPFGPQATLFNDDGTQITTHFLSPNPDEDGKARPTWQHSRDTSAVWANPIREYKEPDYVEPGAISWLLLERVGREPGPDGGRRLYETTFIQRVHTSGGVAPTTGCVEVGARALVPYTTDYYFYRAAR